jgi:hypothetical protein
MQSKPLILASLLLAALAINVDSTIVNVACRPWWWVGRRG